MTLYTTRQEAIEQAIAPALGEFGEDYDIDAIADEVLVWHDGYGANPAHPNDYWLGAQGYTVIEDDDEFWAAVERHEHPQVQLRNFARLAESDEAGW